MLDDQIHHTPDGRRLLKGCLMLSPIEDQESNQATKSTHTTPPLPRGKTGGKKTKTAGDRFRVLNSFVDSSLPGLSSVELKTWMILYRDTRNGIAETSQVAIARRAGCSDRAVRKSIKSLEEKGLVQVVYRGALNRGASRYRVQPLRNSRS